MSAQINTTERDANQVQAYRRADSRDAFYGEDPEYREWSERYSQESLLRQMAEDGPSFAKEEATMRRLGLSCSCGMHMCDGGCR